MFNMTFVGPQLVTMEKESEEEIRRLRKEEAWSREEAHTLLRGAERSREEEEEEAKRRNIDLTTQMENLQKTHQTEVCLSGLGRASIFIGQVRLWAESECLWVGLGKSWS